MLAKNDPSYFGGSGKTVAPVVGLRNWRIDPLFRLTGVIFRVSVWTPGENTAMCGNKVAYTNAPQLRPADHSMDACPHGFYAYYDGSRDYHERGDVTGIIQGYGETVIGTKGFRCTKARILAFKFSSSIPDMVQARIRASYPEVAAFRSLNQMIAEYPTTGGDFEYKPEDDPNFWTKDA